MPSDKRTLEYARPTADGAGDGSALYPGRHLTSEDIMRAVAALGPKIDEMVPAIREAGRLPDELMEDLRATGIFRAAFPAVWGGPEMPLTDQLELIEGLARHDASVAWACMILFDSGFFAGNFDRSVVRDIYPSMDMATAVSQYPLGRADRVDGGYRVTGRFKFGSGSFNADIFVCPCRVHADGEPVLDDNGKVQETLFFVPANEVTVHDVWRTIGLQGTGSTDYSVENVFVPAHRTCTFDEKAIVEQRPPLSRHNQYLAVSQLAVTLGLTRHILDELESTVATRVSTKTEKQIKGDYAVQTGVPEALAMFGAARAYVYEYARDTDDILFRDLPLTHEHTAKLAMVSVASARLCRLAVDGALELVGTDAIHRDRPWEPLYQDFRVATSHILHRRQFYAEAFRPRAG